MMVFSTLIRRDLTSIFRDARTPIVYAVVALLGIMASLGMNEGGYNFAAFTVHRLAFLALSISTALIAGDALAREHLLDTDALLRLARVPPWTVIASKFLAAYISGLGALIVFASLPLAHAVLMGTAHLGWLVISLGVLLPLALGAIASVVVGVGSWIRSPKVATPITLVAAMLLVLPSLLDRGDYTTPIDAFARAIRSAAWGGEPNVGSLLTSVALSLVVGFASARLGFGYLRTHPPGGE